MRRHTPVLLQETLEALPEQCGLVMDGTLGHGGHTSEIIKHIGNQEIAMDSINSPQAHSSAAPSTGSGGQQTPRNDDSCCRVIGVDRDEAMIAKAKVFLEEKDLLGYVQIVQGSYADFTKIRQETGVNQVDAILLDIGVNMDHFKEADRGFSIKLDGELDMRYDRRVGEPASLLLEKYSYEQLSTMLEKWTDFGQTYREQIAKARVGVRKRKPFRTTQDVRARAKEFGINDKKLAVVFQAIRIEVNNELGELELFLQSFSDFLITKGRCIVITYHSIEDRLVKYAFKDLVDQGVGVLVNKKVIKPDWKEVKKNKAARSAKLRIFEKI